LALVVLEPYTIQRLPLQMVQILFWLRQHLLVAVLVAVNLVVPPIEETAQLEVPGVRVVLET